MGKRREPETVRVAREVGAEMGARVVGWEISGGGHIKITMEIGGRSVKIFTANSSSDGVCFMANHRRTVARALRNPPQKRVA